jgi:hypothetical protein
VDLRRGATRRTLVKDNERSDPPRRESYLGHCPKTITDLYRWHDVVRFLDGDAEKLVGFLVGSLGQGPTQTLMTRAGIEPAAYGLKVRCSTN